MTIRGTLSRLGVQSRIVVLALITFALLESSNSLFPRAVGAAFLNLGMIHLSKVMPRNLERMYYKSPDFLARDEEGVRAQLPIIEETFERAIKWNPTSHRAARNLARVYVVQGNLWASKSQWERAIDSYSMAIRAYNSFVLPYRLIGEVLLEELHSEEAIGWLHRASSLAPESFQYHTRLADAYRTFGYFEEAIQELTVANRLYPTAYAYHQLGGILLVQGRWSEAVVNFQRSLELVPDNPWGLLGLGDAYICMGYREEAMQFWQRLVQLYPDFERGTQAVEEQQCRYKAP